VAFLSTGTFAERMLSRTAGFRGSGIIPPPIMKNWKATVAGMILAALGIAHSLWPQRLSMDWPSVTLLIAGVFLCFSGHVAAFLPYVKRLKLGQAEIELQEKLGDLSKNVKQLEDAPEKAIHHASPTTTDVSETSIESTILDIASKDKAAALIRLGIEIEKRLALLCKEANVMPEHRTWRDSVNTLTRAKILEPRLGSALIEFRDVRNQVIHSGLRAPVQQSMLTRAIDDGLNLLKLL
jgi:hypothetical protein